MPERVKYPIQRIIVCLRLYYEQIPESEVRVRQRAEHLRARLEERQLPGLRHGACPPGRLAGGSDRGHESASRPLSQEMDALDDILCPTCLRWTSWYWQQ